MSRKTIYRSSITGRIVSKKNAEANPDTTVKETVCNLEKELIGFVQFLFPIVSEEEGIVKVKEYLKLI